MKFKNWKSKGKRILSSVISLAILITMLPEIWLPVHAEMVRNNIINEQLNEEDTSIEAYGEKIDEDFLMRFIEEDGDPKTDTATAPEGYLPKSNEMSNTDSIQRNMMAVKSVDEVKSVLLIEDTLAWRTNTNESLLIKLGISYKKVKTQDFMSQDLGNFSVIIFANDQAFATYSNYSTFKDQIELFAELGGVVIFGACDSGWASGTLADELPGGVKKTTKYASNNYIADFEHPIVTCELSDGISLTNSILTGNYCSHVHFDEDTLPDGTKIILRDFDNNAPTLIEYPLGYGKIIASGLTWEHNYVYANAFSTRSMDDLFLYALSIGNIDVNALPPIAISVDAPSQLDIINNLYSPNPIKVKALMKNISDYDVEDVNVELLLPQGLSLSGNSEANIFLDTMLPGKQQEVIWEVHVSPTSTDQYYQYQVLLTAADGYQKVVTRTIFVPALEQSVTLPYTIFSGSRTADLNLYGWKSYFNGDVYTGRNFNYGGSEFYVNGKIDAAGYVSANGWMIEISDINEEIEPVEMPDFDAQIHDKAEPWEFYEISPAYVEDQTIINGSIKAAGDVVISGTTFEGDCYIISEGDITYNVHNFNTSGQVLLYSRNGNITINGTTINLNGIMYAPNGCVTFNTYETTLNGRVVADTINFSGSIFNITGNESDWELIGGGGLPVIEPADVSISADVPKYIQRDSEHAIQIIDENNVGNLSYTATFNNETLPVDEAGQFIINAPEIQGEYILIISASEPNGGSDTKMYTVILDDMAPTVKINTDRTFAYVGSDDIKSFVTVEDDYDVVETKIYINNELKEYAADEVFYLSADTATTYIIRAEASDAAGNLTIVEETIVIEQEITDTEAPIVDIHFDKEIYHEGDSVTATVVATDNVGVVNIELYFNGTLLELDENNNAVIENLVLESHQLTALAYDAAGNIGRVTYTLIIEDKEDDSYPELLLRADKTTVELGDTVSFEIEASDKSGTVYVSLFANNTEIELINNAAVFKPDSIGEYEIIAYAENPSGNRVAAKIIITVVSTDKISPEVNIILDKEVYFESDDIVITVIATDNISVEKIVLKIDDEEVMLNENNSYTIKNAEKQIYTVIADAYDASGNRGTATSEIPVNEAYAPVISAIFDKDIYFNGDTLQALITAQGQSEIVSLIVTVNGVLTELDDGMLEIENLVEGNYDFVIVAEDSNGLKSTKDITITVGKNEETKDYLKAEINGIVEYGDTDVLKITASEEVDVSTITVSLNNENIKLNDDLTYKFIGEQLFENIFVISAKTFNGENLSITISTKVVDREAPTLAVTFDKDEYSAKDDMIAYVDVYDNCEIKRVEFTFDGVEYEIDENGYVTIPSIVIEPHIAVVRAWDTFGNCSTSVTAFIVVIIDGKTIITDEDDEADTSLTSIIYTPSDGQSITAPTMIVGTAGGTDFVKYVLDYAPVGSNSYTVLKEGTDRVNASVLGEIDTTLLKNGLYTLRLTVYSETGGMRTSVVISVEGQMKIGNFSIAFQDMDVNVLGLPLTVIRSYDSRDRNNSGDFGYGWDMSTSGVTLTESCILGGYWNQITEPGSYGMNTYVMKETRAHIITVNWGNGQTEKFKVTTNPYRSTLYPIQYDISYTFTAMDGSKSKLQALDGCDYLLYTGGYLLDTDSYDVSDPTRYRLTKQDGTIYIINKNSGVESITDPNGNVIRFTRNGITHSDGKNITFNRDAQGRITDIKSPTGKTVLYTYDKNGDLASVTDVLGEVTKFTYDNHYLTEIIDPRGITVSRNIYDDEGRLVKTIDADGNEIKYDHDIDGREERITDRNGNVTRYIYDHEGNILSQTDPMGNTVKNTYDKNGNIETKTDAMGNVTNYNYDESGNLLGMSDAAGNTVSNDYNSKGFLTSINAMGINALTATYDSNGNISSTADALGNEINYSYDNKGSLKSVTDEIGVYMNMTYDSEGNVISATNGAGTTEEFTYDRDGNCISKTISYTEDSEIKTITENYVYDASGNLIKIIDSDGNITTTEYNSMGKIASATDEKGRQTKYDYDVFGNLEKITYSDGTTEIFTYDREGNNLTATDRLGRTVTMTYDKVGNLLTKSYPNGAKVSYTYDKNYQLISETSTSGGVTLYEYDSIGRNIAITDALGNKTKFEYNSHSQLESMIDAKENIYNYSYDLNGNRIKTTYPDSTFVTSEYDARGRVTSQTDQNGYVTKYVYDGADRLTSVTDALENTTNYTYDEVGNLTTVTDAKGNTTYYAYDDFGRVIRTTNALGMIAQMTYDVSGKILTSTDFGGNLTTYTYDSLDRMTSKTTSDGTVKYAYTIDGKLSSVTDSTGMTTFEYDNMDGLTKVVYSDESYVEYSYDDSCRLTEISTEYGSTQYEYDIMDRLVRVVDRNGYATIYEYDANGNRSAVRYANGIITTYEYDDLNRLISEKSIDKDSNVVAQYIYTLGLAGERTSVTELDCTIQYVYDELYRLVGETITQGDETTVYTYAYDSVSNRISKTENDTETVYTYNAINQLLLENDTTYEYDNAGNLIRMISPTKSALYEYNSENKLVKATTQDGNNVVFEIYTYDFAGNRTSKSTSASNGNTEYTRYLLDINTSLTMVLVELNADGTEKAYYTRGFELISQERDGTQSYYLYDGHGSVRQLTDENGKITDTYSYDAWGNLLDSTGDTVNNYLYCGEQFDGTTGLYYLRARYMNPNTGTFISMDTYQGTIFDPISLHKYLYANANPVMYSDPSGYMVLELAGVGFINTNEHVDNAAWAMGVYKWAKATLLGLFYVSSTVVAGYVAHNLATYIDEAITTGNIVLSDLGNKIKELVKTGALATLLGAGIIGNNTVYVVYDPNQPETIIYVGRTNDIPIRQDSHNHNAKYPERWNWKLTPVISGLSKNAARVAEQLLIATYSFTAGSLVNKRREIAPGKLNKPEHSVSIDLIRAQLGVAEDEVYELMRGN